MINSDNIKVFVLDEADSMMAEGGGRKSCQFIIGQNNDPANVGVCFSW